jgi:hypothetical protein
MKIKLPEELENKYYEIKREYSKIQYDWRKYNDETIPEDKEFAKKIIQFIIQVIDYIITNYDGLDIKNYQEFLAYYDYEFFYGPNGDDKNYLTFDETLNGEPVTEFCWELKDDDFKLTKDKLAKIKSKYSQVMATYI